MSNKQLAFRSRYVKTDGTSSDDESKDATTIIKKILSAKLFDGPDGGLWKQSVRDINGEILCG